jgi:predicted tellurium resistance membrane protein TerC
MEVFLLFEFIKYDAAFRAFISICLFETALGADDLQFIAASLAEFCP